MPSSSLFLRSSTTLVSALSLISSSFAAPAPSPLPSTAASTSASSVYTLDYDFFSGNFFDSFNFFADADPTHGYVTYVDRNNASHYGSGSQANLIDGGNNGRAAYMRVDYTKTYPAPSDSSAYYGKNGIGRPSVRIESIKSWTHALIIGDFKHMPQGCGTWPAFWTLGSGTWPNNGEIDIIEGWNDQNADFISAHVANTCSVSPSSNLTGTVSNTDCDYNDGFPNYTGCKITDSDSKSYGVNFNNNQGGVYAMEWTSEAIKVWFFPRGQIPSDITSGKPKPSGWGTPLAYIGGSGCDVDLNFKEHRIIFDNTFCGDAGAPNFDSCRTSQYSQCDAFVARNPSSFRNAYWEVDGLKVYTQTSSTTTTSSTSTSTTSSTSTTHTSTSTTSASTTSSATNTQTSTTTWSPTTSSSTTSSATNTQTSTTTWSSTTSSSTTSSATNTQTSTTTWSSTTSSSTTSSATNTQTSTTTWSSTTSSSTTSSATNTQTSTTAWSSTTSTSPSGTSTTTSTTSTSTSTISSWSSAITGSVTDSIWNPWTSTSTPVKETSTSTWSAWTSSSSPGKDTSTSTWSDWTTSTTSDPVKATSSSSWSDWATWSTSDSVKATSSSVWSDWTSKTTSSKPNTATSTAYEWNTWSTGSGSNSGSGSGAFYDKNQGSGAITITTTLTSLSCAAPAPSSSCTTYHLEASPYAVTSSCSTVTPGPICATVTTTSTIYVTPTVTSSWSAWSSSLTPVKASSTPAASSWQSWVSTPTASSNTWAAWQSGAATGTGKVPVATSGLPNGVAAYKPGNGASKTGAVQVGVLAAAFVGAAALML